MKAIQITNKDKEANKKLLENIEVDTVLSYEKQLPNSWNQISPFGNVSDEVAFKNRFYNVNRPALQEGDRYINLEISDFDIEKKEWFQRVELIPQQTAQELYNQLIEEGKLVFEEFENLLARAATPYSILGTIPNELKVLTQTLLDVKLEIKNGLKYYLDNNMIEKLKSFNYYDDRAVELKNKIENFK